MSMTPCGATVAQKSAPNPAFVKSAATPPSIKPFCSRICSVKYPSVTHPAKAKIATLMLLVMISDDINTAMAAGTFFHKGGDGHVSRSPMVLDAEGWEEVLEVLDRVGVRAPVRLCQATQIARRRVVSDLILGVPVGHSPQCPEHHGADQRAQMRWSTGLVLELAAPDLLDELLQLGPVRLLRDHDQPVVRRDLDDGALRTRKQLCLSTARST